MIKHTPGPWHYGDEHVNRREFNCFSIGNGACSVAQVAVYPAISRDEAKANARLIAAAPDLLEACQTMLRLAEGLDLGESNSDEVEQLRDAITKAQGGER